MAPNTTLMQIATQRLFDAQRAVDEFRTAGNNHDVAAIYIREATIAAWDFANAVSDGQEMPGADGEFYGYAAKLLLVAAALGVAVEADEGDATPAAVLATLRALSADRSGAAMDEWFKGMDPAMGGQVVQDAYRAACEAAGPVAHVRASVRVTAQMYLRAFGWDAWTAWAPGGAVGR